MKNETITFNSESSMTTKTIEGYYNGEYQFKIVDANHVRVEWIDTPEGEDWESIEDAIIEAYCKQL